MSDFDAWRRWADDLDDASFARVWLALGAMQARQVRPQDPVLSLRTMREIATLMGMVPWSFPRIASPFGHECRKHSPNAWASAWNTSVGQALDQLPRRIDVGYLDEPTSAWFEALNLSSQMDLGALVLPSAREGALTWPLRIGALTGDDKLLVEALVKLLPEALVSSVAESDAAALSCDMLVYTGEARDLMALLGQRNGVVSARLVILGSDASDLRERGGLADVLALVKAIHADGFVAAGQPPTAQLLGELELLVSELRRNRPFREATYAAWGAHTGRALIGLSGSLAQSPIGIVVVEVPSNEVIVPSGDIVRRAISPGRPRFSLPGREERSLGSIDAGSDEAYAGGLESFGEEVARADRSADVAASVGGDFSPEVGDLDDILASLPEASAPSVEEVRAESPKRRLIADAWSSGDYRRAALLPDVDHELHVRIAIPGQIDTAAQTDFPEHELPAGGSVELMVAVTSDELGLNARLPIVLSTSNSAASSTAALFTFRTPSEGSVVDIKILVTYLERPLQEAHFVASVRARPIASDRAQLNAVFLSSSPEPIADATPAQVSLEVNGANLERTGSRAAIDQTQLRDLLDHIDRIASRVLASDDAPESLDDAAGEKLLVSLARYGASLRRNLARLQIGDATTISLLVDANTPILPLELVYDGPTPTDASKLCEHRPGGTMVGKAEVCSNLSTEVVCPYAFWGQHRVIARTIRYERETDRPAAPVPLNLRPVLYAAVDRADANAPADKKPSDMLAADIEAMVGTARMTRVRDWTDWKQQVRHKRPQLMIVLGHTESSGPETGIEIGNDSWLYDPDIDADHLCDEDAPRPLVVLLACSTGVPRNCFGGLPGAFTGRGAAAVVATLTKLRGPHGARAATAVVRALCSDDAVGSARLGIAMTSARHQLIKEGLLAGLLLVSHGEIDLPLINR